MLRALGLPAAFVGSQGAFTGGYDARGALRPTGRHPAPLDAVRAVVAAAVAAGLAVSWFAVDRWLVSHVDATIEREAQVVHDTPDVADLLAQDDGPDKLMIIARDADDLPALGALACELPSGLTAQISNPTYLEITRSGVDKASAVRQVLRATRDRGGVRRRVRGRPERPRAARVRRHEHRPGECAARGGGRGHLDHPEQRRRRRGLGAAGARPLSRSGAGQRHAQAQVVPANSLVA